MTTSYKIFLLSLLTSNLVVSQNKINFSDRIFYDSKEAFKFPLNVYNYKMRNQHVNTERLNLSTINNLENLNFSYDRLVELTKRLKKSK
jgi:hypothetical protein